MKRLARRKRKTPRISPAGIAARASGRRALLDGLVRQMHAEYQAGASVRSLGRKFGRSPAAIRNLFQLRGLPLRAYKSVPRQPNGAPVKMRLLSRLELRALAARLTRLVLPDEVRREWRRWDLAKRAWFVALVRARLNRPEDCPRRPYSANVEPFAYGSPKAHALVARLNRGLTSRNAAAQLKLVSQGVIYQGRLYFWASDRNGRGAGAYYAGPWQPGRGRPALHRLIWEETHGRPIPPGGVVRHADGNPNNLDPTNLVLSTRDDLARENQARALLLRSRELTSLLLHRSRIPKGPKDAHLIHSLSAGTR